MEFIHWTAERPELDRPLMLLAFEGWNDAGDAASVAARHIRDRFGGTEFASLDAEPFYDFTTSRPTVRLDGEGRAIEWPANTFSCLSHPQLSRDMIIMIGTEPQLRWRTYTEQILAMVEEYDVDLVISMGALVADVAHSRPAPIYSAAYDDRLLEELNLEPSTYEGPTGIVGVVHNALQAGGQGSVSLWAAIPSYVPHATSPKAALALVNRVGQLVDSAIPTTALEIASAAYERQISELVQEDEDTVAYIAQLEEHYDSSLRLGSGEQLIEELEQYLKERGD